MPEQFSELASKLLDRITNLTPTQKKLPNLNPNPPILLPQPQPKKTPFSRTSHPVSFPLSPNIHTASPQTQTLLQLTRIEQDLEESQEENIRKFKNVNEEVRKLENFVKEEMETRLKLHEGFIHSVIKAEKNMQNTMANIHKIYSERQKKLQQKIQQVLKSQQKQILSQLQSNIPLQQSLAHLKHEIQSTKQQLLHMKRTRHQLQSKITTQFNDQIKDLKIVFANSVKFREERELRILDMLKNVYKRSMDSIKKEEVDREACQKMFLTVIQQLIDRITEA